jgi:hypothetical protein
MTEPDSNPALLTTLLHENTKELVFWRERNWATLKLVVGAYIALTGLSIFDGASNALILLVLALALVSTVYLRKNFRRYQERREVGARIERALGLYEKGKFLPDDSLLPERFAQPMASWKGSGSFIFAVWAVALAAIFAIVA